MHEVPTVAGVHFLYHAYCLCTRFPHKVELILFGDN